MKVLQFFRYPSVDGGSVQGEKITLVSLHPNFMAHFLILDPESVLRPEVWDAMTDPLRQGVKQGRRKRLYMPILIGKNGNLVINAWLK